MAAITGAKVSTEPTLGDYANIRYVEDGITKTGRISGTALREIENAVRGNESELNRVLMRLVQTRVNRHPQQPVFLTTPLNFG